MNEEAFGPKASKHAVERIRERTKLPKRAVAKLVRDAWFKGTPVGEIHGDLRYWIEAKRKRHPGEGLHVRVYQHQMFVFGDAITCITVIPIPREVR